MRTDSRSPSRVVQQLVTKLTDGPAPGTRHTTRQKRSSREVTEPVRVEVATADPYR